VALNGGMMRTLFALVFLLVSAVDTAAPGSVRFRATLTDARSALLAYPRVRELNLTKAQLQSAAGDRVVMLDRTRGLKWTWLMLSWQKGTPADEYWLSAAGVVGTKDEAIFAVEAVDEQRVKIRCAKDCRITFAVAERDPETVDVAADAEVIVPFGATIDLAPGA
jgi:hypothetical protein